MRVAAINLRAKPEQRDLIDRAAEVLGKTRSDFMLETACQRAQDVLLDQVFFTLTAKQYQEVLDYLDGPPEPNPGLERLRAVVPPWKRADAAAAE
ncbi:MAG: DUF1778 domain-containing protein [Pseudoxanthomonas sp.]